jgi:hypothetical protein
LLLLLLLLRLWLWLRLRTCEWFEQARIGRHARNPALSDTLKNELGLDDVFEVLFVDLERLTNDSVPLAEHVDVGGSARPLLGGHLRVLHRVVSGVGEVATFILKPLEHASSTTNLFAVTKDATFALVFELCEARDGSKDLRTTGRWTAKWRLLRVTVGRLLRGRGRLHGIGPL